MDIKLLSGLHSAKHTYLNKIWKDIHPKSPTQQPYSLVPQPHSRE